MARYELIDNPSGNLGSPRTDRPWCWQHPVVDGVVPFAAAGDLIASQDVTGLTHVSFVVTNTGGAGATHTYTYQGSPDGVLWADLGTDAGVAVGAVASHVETALAYRFVRIRAQETALGANSTATAWITGTR